MASNSPQETWQFNSETKWRSYTLANSASGSASPADSRVANTPDDLLLSIADVCVTGVAVLDEFGALLYANKAWCSSERSGYPGDKRGPGLEEFFSWRNNNASDSDNESSSTLGDDIQRMLSGAYGEFHGTYCRPGTKQPFFIHAAQLNLPGPLRRILISHDVVPNSVTEQEYVQKALQEIGGRVIAAQEEERKRIARELHDDLSQRLALLSVELQELGGEIDKAHARRRLRRIQSQARDISTDIQTLSYKLHPLKLQHVGLSAAVQSLCNEISRNGNLKVAFIERDVPAHLSADITLCLFRITQELLRNCVRHSGAQLAHLYLRKVGDAICLTVSDNGCGFDAKSGVIENGMGLINMRERLNVVGGESEIVSHPRRGTCINISIPL